MSARETKRERQTWTQWARRTLCSGGVDPKLFAQV